MGAIVVSAIAVALFYGLVLITIEWAKKKGTGLSCRSPDEE